MPSSIVRLDEWLVKEGYAPDLKKAAGLILTGDLLVNDTPLTKAGYRVKPGDQVRLRNQRRFVARSGQKLWDALLLWNYTAKDLVFLDIGASTGGFTEVLLEKSAQKVYAVDVGYGLLSPRLRNDGRVVPIERTHICDLDPKKLDPAPDAFVADLSFISLRKVIPCLQEKFPLFAGVVLFKPQFEASPQMLDGGVVTNPDDREALLESFARFLESRKVKLHRYVESSLPGTKGNLEYLLEISWSL